MGVSYLRIQELGTELNSLVGKEIVDVGNALPTGLILEGNEFFISLFIGFMMCYILTPPPKIVFKHPTPENAGKIIYKDNGDSCYKYIAEQVECPANQNEISDFNKRDRC